MATVDELKRALIQAHNAGDKNAAQLFAQKIKTMLQVPAVNPDDALSGNLPAPIETALIGAGKFFTRAGQGAQQAYYGLTGDTEAQQNLKKQVDAENAIYNPLAKAHPVATAIGESLPSMVIPMAGGGSLLAQGARMGLTNAALQAEQYGTGSEKAERGITGGITGLATPALGAGISALYNTGKSFTKSGSEKLAAQLLNYAAKGGEGGAEGAAARMINAQPLVEGTLPTAAEVAQNTGISGIQRTAMQKGADINTRLEQNRLARVAQLENIAGTPEERAELEKYIMQQSEKNYGDLKGQAVPEESILPAWNRLTESQQGYYLGKAKQLAQNKGEPFSEDGQLTGNAFHYIKKAMDNEMQKTTSENLGPLEKGALLDIQRQMIAGYPEYQNAMQTHEAISKPLNAMQIGKYLSEQLQPPLARGTEAMNRETADKFAAALANPDDLAKTATGFSGANYEKIMTPEQQAAIEAVRQDLGRVSNIKAGNSGSGTYAHGQNAADIENKAVIQSIMQKVPVLRAFSAPVFEHQNQRTQQAIIDALLNPQEGGQLMMKYKPLTESEEYQRNLLAKLLSSPSIAGGQYMLDQSRVQ